MNYTELKEKTDQYVETLPNELGTPTLRSLGESILASFLWWLYPQMKNGDLPNYGPSPLERTYKVFHVLKEDVEAELYRIQHPERCPPGDPMCPQQELTCPTCDGATVVLDVFEGVVNCPRCG